MSRHTQALPEEKFVSKLAVFRREVPKPSLILNRNSLFTAKSSLCGPFPHPPKYLNHPINILKGRVPSQGEADERIGKVRFDAHCQKHMRRFQRASRTCRTA